MSGILYKNFHIYKIDLIVMWIMNIIMACVVIFSAAVISPNEREDMMMGIYPTLYFSMFLLAGVFEHQLFLADEKRTIGSFIISNPLGAKGHVEGKYYTLLIVNIAVLVLCFLTDAIVCAIADTRQYSASGLLIIFFSVSLIFSAFSSPFYLRFGTNYGNGAKFGALGLIMVFIFLYFLFGDLSFIFESDVPPNEAIMQFLSSGNALLVLSFVPPVSILLYYISFRISVPLYRKGVESYEQ